jgi:hypothetical protein
MEESRKKYKSKIKKLLELSLSDNENEAATALRQAMYLMNKHNITKEEVEAQAMAQKIITTPYHRLPEWYLMLAFNMSKISGCYMVFRNSTVRSGKKAFLRFVGRERDVENSDYLMVYFQRALEKSVESYKWRLNFMIGKKDKRQLLFKKCRK